MSSERAFADPVFRGCTRTAMLLGVPIVPMLCILGSILLLSMYVSLWLMFVALPVVLVVRQLCANDDAFFSQKALRLHTRMCFADFGLGSDRWRLVALELRRFG